MNQNSERNSSDKSLTTNPSGAKSGDKDKIYSLQGLLSKINKTDVSSFGNYYVDFSEMFPDPSEFQK
jgi:hypothetical protein